MNVYEVIYLKYGTQEWYPITLSSLSFAYSIFAYLTCTITSYILLTTCFFFFFFFLVSCSGPDPPALEIGALQAVSGERLGLLPQRWRVFCHRDLKWPSQALQVGNQRNKVKFWLGGFKLMGILYSICQKNDPSGASSQSVPFSLSFPPPLHHIIFLISQGLATCFERLVMLTMTVPS